MSVTRHVNVNRPQFVSDYNPSALPPVPNPFPYVAATPTKCILHPTPRPTPPPSRHDQTEKTTTQGQAPKEPRNQNRQKSISLPIYSSFIKRPPTQDHATQTSIAGSPHNAPLQTESSPQSPPVHNEAGQWTLNAPNSLGSATYMATRPQPCSNQVSGLAQHPSVRFVEPPQVAEKPVKKRSRPYERTPYPSGANILEESSVDRENGSEDFPWDVNRGETECWCCGKRLVRITEGVDEECMECWAGQVVYE